MLYNEEAVRANIRNREGKRIFYLGKGDQLTSAARAWLSMWIASSTRPSRSMASPLRKSTRSAVSALGSRAA